MRKNRIVSVAFLALLTFLLLRVTACKDDRNIASPLAAPEAARFDVLSTSYGRCGSPNDYLRGDVPTFYAQDVGLTGRFSVGKTWGLYDPPDPQDNRIIPGGVTVYVSKPSSLAPSAKNLGTLIIEPGGHLIITDRQLVNGGVIFNLGTITTEKEFLENTGTLYNVGTVETAEDASGIDNRGIYINCRGGQLNINAGLVVDSGAETAFVNDTSAVIRNHSGLWLPDSVANYGEIDVLLGGYIHNNGKLANMPGSMLSVRALGLVDNPGTLANAGRMTLAGGVFNNTGTITSTGPIVLAYGAVVDTAHGQLRNMSGVMRFTDDTVTVQAGGLLDNEHPDAVTTFRSNASLLNIQGGVVRNEGYFDMKAEVRNDGRIENEGTFIVHGYVFRGNGVEVPVFTNDSLVVNDRAFVDSAWTVNNGRFFSSDTLYISHLWTNRGDLSNQGKLVTWKSIVDDGNIQNLGTWRNFSQVQVPAAGEILNGSGTLDNYGTITLANDVRGSLGLSNQGTLSNACDTLDVDHIYCGTLLINSGSGAYGGLENLGLIDNRAGETITNNFVLDNTSTGTITNEGTIQNNQDVQNDGSITVACGGAYEGSPPIGNPIANLCGSTATTFTAVASGSWNDAATWDHDAVPSLTDTKVVPNGFTVTIPAGASAANSGNMNIAGGALDIEGEFVNLAGASITNTGAVTIGGAFNNQGSVTSATDVTAAGTFVGTVVNNGTFTNGGTLTDTNGATLVNNAQLTNSGAIVNHVIGAEEGGAPEIDNSGTLANQPGGDIRTDLGSIVRNTGTLSNRGTVTSGSEFHNEGQMRNTPSGTFDNQGLLYNPASGSITNNGLFRIEEEVQNAGAFDNQDSLVIANEHTGPSDAGIRNTSTVTNEGAIAIAGPGPGIVNGTATSVLLNSGRITVTGTRGIDNGGTVSNAPGATFTVTYDDTSRAVDNGGHFDNDGHVSITVSNQDGTGILNRDTLANSAVGEIAVSNTAGMGIDNHQGATLANLGTINVTNDQDLSTAGESGIHNAASIDNQGTITLAGTGGAGIYNDAAGTVENRGTLAVANSQPASNASSGFWNAYGTSTLNNDGIIRVSTGGSGSADGIDNSGIFDNATSGTITVSNTGASSTGIENFNNGGAVARVHNDGTLTVSNSAGTGVLNQADVENPGIITLANTGGTAFSNSATVDNTGSIEKHCGASYVGDPPTPDDVVDLCVTMALSSTSGTNVSQVSVTDTVGSKMTFTAHVANEASGDPAAGVTVRFAVGGANEASGSCVSDDTGQCGFSYTGTNAGDDVVTAAAGNGADAITTTWYVTWERLASSLVYDGDTQGAPGSAVSLHATLSDAGSGAGLASETVTFTLDTASVSSTTASDGSASASLTLSAAPGSYSLIAAFAGDNTHLPAADTVPFTAIDTVPPVINTPTDMTAEAAGPDGATVTFSVSAMDNVDGPLTPSCSPASGGVFPLGTTTVHCTASDSSGNTATASFNVTVRDTTAPETRIAGAQDGDGNPLMDGDSTLSTVATLTFDGSDLVGVQGFRCSLDGAPFTVCTSPRNLTGLSDGAHQFRVRATDTSGNVDPTAASFSWSVLSPAQGVDEVLSDIASFGLPHGTASSLSAPLRQIAKLLDDGNPHNDTAACGKLEAFLHHVAAQEGNRLTAEQAAELRTLARAIQARIGC